MSPEALLRPLHHADGSAAYSANGYSVLAAVTGPIEVQRRDELPEEAAVDILVRPAGGVGGIKGIEDILVSNLSEH
jgi:exosome complex component RRP46